MAESVRTISFPSPPLVATLNRYWGLSAAVIVDLLTNWPPAASVPSLARMVKVWPTDRVGVAPTRMRRVAPVTSAVPVTATWS